MLDEVDKSNFKTAFPAAWKGMKESYRVLPRFSGEITEGLSKFKEMHNNMAAQKSGVEEDLVISLVLLFQEYAKQAPKEKNPKRAVVLVARAATCSLFVANPLGDIVFSSDRLERKWSTLQREGELIAVKNMVELFASLVIDSCIKLKNQRKANVG